MDLWEIAGMLNLIQYRNDALCHSDESQHLIRTMGLWEIAAQTRNDDTLFLGFYWKLCGKPIKPLLPKAPLAVMENGKIIIRKDYYTKKKLIHLKVQ
jgi:hypothetical protein